MSDGEDLSAPWSNDESDDDKEDKKDIPDGIILDLYKNHHFGF